MTSTSFNETEQTELAKLFTNPLMQRYLKEMQRDLIETIARSAPQDPLETWAREKRFNQGILYAIEEFLKVGEGTAAQ